MLSSLQRLLMTSVTQYTEVLPVVFTSLSGMHVFYLSVSGRKKFKAFCKIENFIIYYGVDRAGHYSFPPTPCRGLLTEPWTPCSKKKPLFAFPWGDPWISGMC